MQLFLADALLKTWCKYRYGVFEENGYFDDHYYPQSYAEGNQTLPNAGCQPDDFTMDNTTGNKYLIFVFELIKELNELLSVRSLT
jgi:hypothetical protein